MTQGIEKNLALAELLDAESFREVCRSFSELYGIGIRIFDEAGSKIVDIRASTSDHCGYLFTVHPTKVLCTNLVNQVRSQPVDVAAGGNSCDCFSGLRYKIVPIVYEGSVMGRVIFGPYAPEGLEGPPASLAQYREQGLDLDTLGRYQQQVPRAGEDAVDKVLRNISNVLDVIIHTSYKTWLTSQMHITSITGAFEDLERTNRDLQTANEKLQDLDRLKSNFIATVSHELRTPLTSVIGYSEMLIEGMAGPINDEQRGYVNTILEKGESLLGLIGQILDLARIESGNVTINKRETPPAEVVEKALSDIRPQAAKRGLKLGVDIGDDVLPILVDDDKIRRVLTNLLGNAVKFTNPGGAIHISARLTEAPPTGTSRFDIFQPERNRYLEFKVVDTGIGIPTEKLQRIFESFFQVDNTSTREFGGSGLGLSIAKNFVSAHGGQIRVESEVGVGSTFTILLPYAAEPPTAGTRIDGLQRRDGTP